MASTTEQSTVVEQEEPVQPIEIKKPNPQLDVASIPPQEDSKDESLKSKTEVIGSLPSSKSKQQLLTIDLEKQRQQAELTKLVNAEIGFTSALETINSRINAIIDKAKTNEHYIPAKEKAVELHDALLSAGSAFFIHKTIKADQFKLQCHEAIKNARIGNARTELEDWSDVFSIITSITTSVRRGLVNTAGKLGFFPTITEQQLDTLDNSLQQLVLP